MKRNPKPGIIVFHVSRSNQIFLFMYNFKKKAYLSIYRMKC